MLQRVRVPLLLSVVAVLCAATLAYGTQPAWMQYPHGLQVIVWSYRLQWLLVAISLLCCVGLIGLAMSARRRMFWLVALAPVLVMFAHRFAIGPAAARMHVVENPSFVDAAQASLRDDAWVVVVPFGDTTYAYPYASLFSVPVILQADHDRRMVLLWSAYANRALALPISQDFRARQLDIVSTPANALLLHDSAHGQFINGLTGRTLKNQTPAGFLDALPLATHKLTWGEARSRYPQARVLAIATQADEPTPSGPIEPSMPMPPMKLDRPPGSRVVLIGAFKPLAFAPDQLSAAPFNGNADDRPVAVVRSEPAEPIHALSRWIHSPIDLILQFEANAHPRKHPKAFMIDAGSDSGWTADGLCIEAGGDVKALRGRQLDSINVDEQIPWNVAKFWYPDLQLQNPSAPTVEARPAESAHP